MPNPYVTLAAQKRFMQIASTDFDTLLLELIESASREIDAHCRRHFYTATATRRFVPETAGEAAVDDLLSVTTASLVDPDDSTVEAVDYATTEYELQPFNSYPKLRFRLLSTATASLRTCRPSLEIVGLFGYGDGQSASPWAALTTGTGTVASTTGTGLTLSVASIVEAGQTLLIGTEQMFVQSVATTTATVVRGVNGTTAATHSTAAISVAQYPAKIVQAARAIVVRDFNDRKMAGQSSEAVDSYNRVMMTEEQRWQMLNRLTSGYTRGS